MPLLLPVRNIFCSKYKETTLIVYWQCEDRIALNLITATGTRTRTVREGIAISSGKKYAICQTLLSTPNKCQDM